MTLLSLLYLVGAITFINLVVSLFVYKGVHSLNERDEEGAIKKNHPLFQTKLQAYERLLLFVNRIKPSELVQDLPVSASTDESVSMLIQQIRKEFKHNLSQRLFVHDKTWQQIELFKEKSITYLLNTHQKKSGSILSEFKVEYLNHSSEIEDQASLLSQAIKKSMQIELY